VHGQITLGGHSGELMQLESCRDESERFNHYLQKTFMKTASLMAYSCQAVSLWPQLELLPNNLTLIAAPTTLCSTSLMVQPLNQNSSQLLRYNIFASPTSVVVTGGIRFGQLSVT